MLISHCVSGRSCLELLSQLEEEEESSLLAELHALSTKEEELIQELEAIELQREAVAKELAQGRAHSQQLDTEELQCVLGYWCKGGGGMGEIKYTL